ncbi:TPA: hypothetical protein DEG75_01590 [Candidatus Dependentiae bacterium]|nr:hypothetical protein [Candidatus Dependentiae bacterium]
MLLLPFFQGTQFMKYCAKLIFLTPLICSVNLFFPINNVDILFVNLSQLRPTQVRYSSENVNDKVTKAIKQGDTNKEFSTFKYDNGQSIFSTKDALPVIATNIDSEEKTPLFYLIDGHHSALASFKVKAKTIPVKIEDIYYPAPGTNFFWEWAQKHQYTYLKDTDGSLRIPEDFNTLTNDPIRYFAALAARKFEKDTNYKNSTGAEFPLWVKIGKDIPFIEFHIADALIEASFVYNYGDEKDKKLFQEKIEFARIILTKKIKELDEKAPLKQLKLLTKQEHFRKSVAIQKWLSFFQ